MPVFNRADKIGRAIESLQRQTYSAWELLVVDDASTDNSGEVAAQYARSDSRVRIFRHAKQSGAQTARNTAIAHASGQWLFIFDAEDLLYPDCLEKRLHVAATKKVHVVHSDCHVLTDDAKPPELLGVMPLEGRVYSILLRGPATNGYFLFSRDALKKLYRLDDSLVAYQDWDLALRLSKFFDFGYVPEPTFLWDRRRKDSISWSNTKNGMGYLQVFRKHFWPILWHAGPAGIAQHYQNAAVWFAKGGDQRMAKRLEMRGRLWSALARRRIRGHGQNQRS